jgi:hypothetical protein
MNLQLGEDAGSGSLLGGLPEHEGDALMNQPVAAKHQVAVGLPNHENGSDGTCTDTGTKQRHRTVPSMGDGFELPRQSRLVQVKRVSKSRSQLEPE